MNRTIEKVDNQIPRCKRSVTHGAAACPSVFPENTVYVFCLLHIQSLKLHSMTCVESKQFDILS